MPELPDRIDEHMRAASAAMESDDPTRVLGLTDPRWLRAVLALNNASAAETSVLDDSTLTALLDQAFLAVGRGVGSRIEAFVIALDQDARYDNPNFAWFKKRYPAFVYVDRVVVAAHARGRGHGRALYADLFAAARGAGHTRIGCEVNRLPPNPGSDAFHDALGFREVGEAILPSGKVVRYLSAACDTDPASIQAS